MDQKEVINIARQALINSKFLGGTPRKITPHPEGGKSLDNIKRIRDYESLLDTPYWEVTFNTADEIEPGTTYDRDRGEVTVHRVKDSAEVVVIVFENGRAFLQTNSLSIRANY